MIQTVRRGLNLAENVLGLGKGHTHQYTYPVSYNQALAKEMPVFIEEVG